MPVFYKGRRLKAPYRADFVCYEEISVELKIESIDQSRRNRMDARPELPQTKASGHERGLLINFGAKSLERRRFIRSHDGAQRN
jgi:GxxExxY protein